MTQDQTKAALAAYYPGADTFSVSDYILMSRAIEAARAVEAAETSAAEDAAMWARIEMLERRHGLRS